MSETPTTAAKLNLFNRWASTYDWVLPSVFYQAVHQRLLECVTLPQDAHILDIGCGTGKLLNRLAQTYPHLTGTGLDFSPEMLARARQKSYALDRLTYQQGASDAIPLPDGTFDAAFCTISFLHYPDPVAVLKEVYRVLKPDGSFYLADYAPPKCIGQSTTNLPVMAGQIRFYPPTVRETLGRQADFYSFDHYYLLGPVVLTVFHKSKN